MSEITGTFGAARHVRTSQLRNLQSLVEIGVDKNTTMVFPAPLMTTIAELGAFISREAAAAGPPTARVALAGKNGSEVAP